MFDLINCISVLKERMSMSATERFFPGVWNVLSLEKFVNCI